MSLPRPDRLALKEHYRALDVQGGGLFWLLTHMAAADELVDTLKALSIKTNADQLYEFLISESVDTPEGDESNYALITYNSYLRLLSDFDIDEGWPRQQLLQQLMSKIPEEAKSSELIAKWFYYSHSIISHERDLQPAALADEKHIVLRAILLHLLNPDDAALDRIADSPLRPGKQVGRLARLLAAAKTGFAPAPASQKEAAPGKYFFISDLMAAVLNGTFMDMMQLSMQQEPGEQASKTQVRWRGYLLAEFYSPSSTLESRNPISARDVDSSTQLDSSRFKLLAASLEKIGEASENEGVIILILTKTIAKGLPRNCSIELRPTEVSGRWLLSSRLLDLSVKSQSAKLTLKRLHAAFIYQMLQGRDFRFDLDDEVSFGASVEFSCDDKTAKKELGDAIIRLVDSHHWMRSPLAK